MENSTFSKINNIDKMVEFECKDNIEVYKKVIFEPIRIGPVSTLDEMDLKVLQFQNKKLDMVNKEMNLRCLYQCSYAYQFIETRGISTNRERIAAPHSAIGKETESG